MADWLLLVYKVPPEPSARRVYVWRKLKRLGAVLLHDAVWVLPANPRTREHLEWLAAEIREMDGDAILWNASLSLADQEPALIQQFVDAANSGYQDLLAALARDDADLVEISKRYQQLKAQDYFASPLGQQVRDALLKAGGSAP